MTGLSLEERFVAARKKLIESEFSRLNPMQRQAVLATEGPLLLLAGAGSGKTMVLINRIRNLLQYGRASDSPELPCAITEQDVLFMERVASGDCSEGEMERARFMAQLEPAEPWRVLAITFTNKAAAELKSRLEAALGERALDIWAMTFHATCVRILRRDCERLGFERSFTIYDTSDSQAVMKRVLKDLNMDEKYYPCKTVLNQISKAKDSLMGPEEFLASARASNDLGRKNIGEAYAEYARRLKAANAMDFDDLIYYTVILLRDCEEVRSYYQRKFRYVLVDEYQDTNHLQYLLTSYLAGGWENLCVVGDDDQSIYKFRGATIENIISFEESFPKARVIRLEQNYRSTGNILQAANAVIRNNVGSKGKTLWTEAGPGDLLTLYTAGNELDEARFVADTIQELVSQGGNWNDNTVLYRMNAQSNQLETAFKQAGIPYRIIGGTRFFDRAEIKDMLAYLCVIETPSDDLRLTRIINVPARGIGQTTVERLRAIASDEGKSLFDVLSRADQYPEFNGGTVKKLLQFSEMIEGLRVFSESHSPDELYDELIEQSGYIRALEEKKVLENEVRIDNIRELKTNIIQYVNNAQDPKLSGFLEEVALFTDIDNYDAGADSVVMMTMHSAKGLEFENVFLVGMEEGIFPGQRTIGDAAEMEEERRLCYVALTRAKKRLFLSCARQRMLFGRTIIGQPSRFTEEIPESCLKRCGKQATSGFDFFDDDDRTYGRSDGWSDSWSDNWSDRNYREPYRKQERAYPRTEKTYAPKPAREKIAPILPKQGNPLMEVFHTGDSVRHKAFGEGVIVKMTPMGGDCLVEINFEGTGSKRLMLRVAAAHMEKI